MGGCCSKSTKAHDSDKLPYGVTAPGTPPLREKQPLLKDTKPTQHVIKEEHLPDDVLKPDVIPSDRRGSGDSSTTTASAASSSKAEKKKSKEEKKLAKKQAKEEKQREEFERKENKRLSKRQLKKEKEEKPVELIKKTVLLTEDLQPVAPPTVPEAKPREEIKVNANKPEETKTSPVTPEETKVTPVKPEDTQISPVTPDSTKFTPVKPEETKISPVRPEDVKLTVSKKEETTRTSSLSSSSTVTSSFVSATSTSSSRISSFKPTLPTNIKKEESVEPEPEVKRLSSFKPAPKPVENVTRPQLGFSVSPAKESLPVKDEKKEDASPKTPQPPSASLDTNSVIASMRSKAKEQIEEAKRKSSEERTSKMETKTEETASGDIITTTKEEIESPDGKVSSTTITKTYSTTAPSVDKEEAGSMAIIGALKLLTATEKDTKDSDLKAPKKPLPVNGTSTTFAAVPNKEKVPIEEEENSVQKLIPKEELRKVKRPLNSKLADKFARGDPLEEDDLDELFVMDEVDHTLHPSITQATKPYHSADGAKTQLPAPTTSTSASVRAPVEAKVVVSNGGSTNQALTAVKEEPTSPITAPAIANTTPTTLAKEPLTTITRQVTANTAPITVRTDVKLSSSTSSTPESSPAKQATNGDTPPTPEHQQQREPVLITNIKNTVKSHLVDLSSSNEVTRGVHDYVPNTRVKLLAAIDNWFSGRDSEKASFSRVVVVKGKNGAGKSCLSTEIARKYKSQIAGSHFFQYNNPYPDHNDPRSVILSLAHSFCDVFPNYINMLPNVDKLEEIVSHGKFEELYNVLIKDALASPGLTHDSGRPMLVVIDAIDEAHFSDRDLLCNIISNFHEAAPSWLHLFVTVQDDNQIVSQLENCTILEMKLSNDLTDIKKIIKEPMSKHMDRISLDGGLTQLAKKSQGSLVFAKIVSKTLDRMPTSQNIAMREVETLFPTGLSGALTEVFSRFQELLLKTESRDVYDVILGIIMLACEPIDINFVTDCSGLKPEDVLESLSDVLMVTDHNKVSFLHRSVMDWLCNEQESQGLDVDINKSRAQFADLVQKWLTAIQEDTATLPYPSVTSYALKHAVCHLTDVPKLQEAVTKFLCSLKVLQARLKLEDFTIQHVIRDYKHEHVQFPDNQKVIVLEEYMDRQQKLVDHIGSYRKFLTQKSADLHHCNDFVFHVAANYPSVQRIHGNARMELGKQMWLEDLTALPETHCISKNIGAQLCCLDASPDGKIIAMVTKDDAYNVKLHLVNAATGEEKVPAVDIKGLKDRVGLCCKFTPDNMAVFVGSLTTVVNLKGKVVPSYLEMQSMAFKEKFSIECCDTSAKYLAAGLNTFPWGGRSMHLTLFDWKTKKCLNTIEVLSFRFGGSSQFGTRCCAISSDGSMVAACVKQANKPQIKATIWDIASWEILYAVDVNNDFITKCSFLENQYLMMGSSTARIPGVKPDKTTPKMKTEMWNFKVAGSESKTLDDSEIHSLYCTNRKSPTYTVKWFLPTGSATICRADGAGEPHTQYSIRGLSDVTEVLVAGSSLVFACGTELRSYNINDLDVVDGQNSADSTNSTVADLITENVVFLPKSNSALVVYETGRKGKVSVGLMEVEQEDISLTPTPFQNEPLLTFDSTNKFKYFHSSSGSTAQICCVSADSNHVTFNSGSIVKVWNRTNDEVSLLPTFSQLNTDAPTFNDSGVHCVISPKDPLVAVVYGQIPYAVYLYDIKSLKCLRTIELKQDRQACVSDLSFVSHNGYLITYHKELSNKLVTWNQRSGQHASVESVQLSYLRVSPSSDRLVLSIRKSAERGELLLRNSDNKFQTVLGMSIAWLPSGKDSDVEFSSDGTTLVGVAIKTQVCRVWNAGNGEVLKDLDISFTNVSPMAEVVGMLTNTHVLFRDDRLMAVDIGSGTVEAMTPLDTVIGRRTTAKGFRVSPKGNVVAGASDLGHIRVLRAHNFSGAKRKTTLQRLKSLSPTTPTPTTPTSPSPTTPLRSLGANRFGFPSK